MLSKVFQVKLTDQQAVFSMTSAAQSLIYTAYIWIWYIVQ